MLCYVMLCYVMFCYVMLNYVMLCYVLLCYAMLLYTVLRYVMLFIWSMLEHLFNTWYGRLPRELANVSELKLTLKNRYIDIWRYMYIDR